MNASRPYDGPGFPEGYDPPSASITADASTARPVPHADGPGRLSPHPGTPDLGFPVSPQTIFIPGGVVPRIGVAGWRRKHGHLSIGEAAAELGIPVDVVIWYIREKRIIARWFEDGDTRYPIVKAKSVAGLKNHLDYLDEVAATADTCHWCWGLVDLNKGRLVPHIDTYSRYGRDKCPGSGMVPEDVEPLVDFTPPTGEIVHVDGLNLVRSAGRRGYVSLRHASRRILRWAPDRTRDLVEHGELPSVWLETTAGVRVPAVDKAAVQAFAERRHHRADASSPGGEA